RSKPAGASARPAESAASTIEQEGNPMEAQLSSSHRTIYDAVFQHPISRNLAWRDMVSMLAALDGVTQQEHNGTLKITRNGRTLVMHQPIRKHVTDVQELMNLRRFLEQPETARPSSRLAGGHLLV